MTQRQLILNQNISAKGNALKVFPEQLKLNALRLRCASYPMAKQGLYNVVKGK